MSGGIVGWAAVAPGHAFQADVAIVGSGAGGAAAAWELAARGARVVIAEDGVAWEPADLEPRPSFAYRNLYQEGGLCVMRGPLSIPLMSGKAVGGSTVVNSAICFRAPEAVLARWRSDHGIEWASRAELDPLYERLERALGVVETDPRIAGRNGLLAKRGLEVLSRTRRIAHGFIRRNAPGCAGCGVCQLGCPVGGKASVDRTLLPEAMANGLVVLEGCKVERLLVSAGRCVGFEGRVRPRSGDGAPKSIAVRAGQTVLAGSAIGTPLLLLSQKLAGGSGQVGKNLHVHPGIGAMGLFDERVAIWSGATQGYYADLGDGIMLESVSATPEVFFSYLRHGELSLRSYDRIAACGAMVADEGSGTVAPRRGRADVRYRPTDRDRARLVRAVRELCRVLLAAGAREVFPGYPASPPCRSEADVLAAVPDDFPLESLSGQASHPHGTCRMGSDPKRHPVGLDGRVREIAGLYVADGSLFPDTLGVNPQMTIMAFALRVAAGIAAFG